MKKRLILSISIAFVLVIALVLLIVFLGNKEHTHAFSEWSVAREATCALEGEEERVCSCGERETKPIAKTEHSFGEWTVTTAPSCALAGEEQRLCVCGIKETRTIASLSHNYVYASDNTYHWKQCSACSTRLENSQEEHGAELNTCSICNGAIGPTDGVLYKISDDGTYAEVVGYKGVAQRVTIAKEYQSLPVKSIGNDAFIPHHADMTDTKYFITFVSIPDTVERIGDSAFYNCQSLETVIIPSSVSEISYDNPAFSRCISLKNIIVDEDNADFVSVDGVLYSKDLSILYQYPVAKPNTEFAIPDTVEAIGPYAFSGCKSIVSIYVPQSVKIMGRVSFAYECDVFHNCESLTDITVNVNNGYYKSIDGNLYTKDSKSLLQYANGKQEAEFTVPDYVENIGSYAFADSKNLKNVIIPASVVFIEGNAFENCASLEEAVIYASIKYINNSAFLNCKSLKTVITMAQIENICVGAFEGCTALESFSIPYGVKTIEHSAFLGCTSLTTVGIPSSVEKIDDYAFYNCTSLENVRIFDVAAWCAIEFGGIEANPFTYADNLYVGDALVSDLVIPASIVSISDYAFRGCNSVVNLLISNGVTSVGNEAFSNCESLKNILIGDTVEKIGIGAFSSLPKIESIIIGSGVSTIERHAFCCCDSLVSIVLPESVTSIGEALFANCDSLASITIGKNIASIGKMAFDACPSLSDVYYTGSEEDWNAIIKAEDNGALTNVTIHYNYVPQ